MADIENTPGTETGNQVIGKVSILYGTVKAISSDGTTRVLALNSPVYADDRIITESDGSVSIVLDDPAQTQLDIGRMSDIILDEDVYGGAAPEDVAEAAAEIEEIQEALLAGDDTGDVEIEATAAGVSSAGGGLTTFVVTPTANVGQVGSGAETTDTTLGTVDTIPGVVPEPAPPVPPPDSQPFIAGLEVGQVEEAEIIDTVSGSLDISSVDGVAAVRVGGVDVTGGGTFPGEYGTLEVTESGGVYSWTYTLTENTLAHSEQGNDTVLGTFAVEVEDSDGDIASKTLTITVVDAKAVLLRLWPA